MRILILAHSLIGQGGWVSGGNFIKSLMTAAPQHKYLITVPADCGYGDISLPEGSEFFVCPKRPSFLHRLRLEKKILPGVAKNFKADAVLGLGNHGLIGIGCPQAIWIRNGYLVYPAKHFPKASLKTHIHVYLQKLHLRRTLAHTDLVFCQTPVMRKRLSDYYSYPESKMKHLPNAISSFLRPPDSQERPPSGIEKGKFNCLILSQYYIHKNPEILIEECLRSPDSFDGICFITTVSENDGRQAKNFLKHIRENPILSRLIHNVGPIQHEYLGSYYRNCQLVIMPTLMESFSITYLEAMHFGVPILTTDLDFAHYLCGEAAVYYDPWKPGSFTEKLLLLKSDQLIYTKLVAAGKEQLKTFSHTWVDVVRVAISGLECLARTFHI